MVESAGLDERADDQTYLDTEEVPEPDSETEVPALVARCVYCGGDMVRAQLPKFNRGFGIVILVMGLLFSLFTLVVGMPIVVVGAYLSVASRSVWGCRACGALVDRNEV